MSYCTREEVNSLFGDISDEVSDELFTTVIDNSTSWIDSALKREYVPVPVVTIETENVTIHETVTTVNVLVGVPSGLRTAAIYHAASDILLSLYHGDTLPVQYDVWFNKAQQLLNDYIAAYKNSDADEADLVAHQQVKHSHGLTYDEKRNRTGGVRRWRMMR